MRDKTSDLAYKALNEFVGPKETVQLFYSDNSLELKRAATDLGFKHGTGTPGLPQTNGVAENAVKRAVQGAVTSLERAGFAATWWPHAIRHFPFSNNITGFGDSPHKNRHGKPFAGPRIPFGALIDFKRSTVRDKTHKF